MIGWSTLSGTGIFSAAWPHWSMKWSAPTIAGNAGAAAPNQRPRARPSLGRRRCSAGSGWYDHVDAILIKEALHHVRNREAVVAGLARLLAPGGRLLVVTLPTTISYPLFRRALEVFAERQPDPADIAGAMQAAGLTVEVTYETYRREFARDRYVAMVRNRHMSLLSEFDDAELENGIREIEREHPEEVLEFDDRFAFVLGRHP